MWELNIKSKIQTFVKKMCSYLLSRERLTKVYSANLPSDATQPSKPSFSSPGCLLVTCTACLELPGKEEVMGHAENHNHSQTVRDGSFSNV